MSKDKSTRSSAHCCTEMARYRKLVDECCFVAGATSDTDSSVMADRHSFLIRTGYEHAELKFNFCPNCGARQDAT